MIIVKELTVKVKTGINELVLLKGINLKVETGELIAVTGPSGSGKSTLLSMIAGLDRPTSGTIEIDRQNLNDLDEDALTRFRGARIGVVFQSYQLIPNLTALENVAVPMELSGESEIPEKSRALLEEVGLGDRAGHYPLQLSGGEQQRVAIARAFSTHPSVLLADEPTGNLDSETGKKIIDLLIGLHLKLRNTMIWVTHDPEVAIRADRQILLRDGRIVTS